MGTVRRARVLLHFSCKANDVAMLTRRLRWLHRQALLNSTEVPQPDIALSSSTNKSSRLSWMPASRAPFPFYAAGSVNASAARHIHLIELLGGCAYFWVALQ